MFTLYKQRIGHYFHQHRNISIIIGHVIVMISIAVALFSGTLSKSLVGVFAQTSCPEGDQTHTVMGGETLSSIATKHSTTWQKLAEHNKIPNPNLIYPGRTLCLPGAYAASAQSNGTSVEGTINDVFGLHGPAALRVARCESSLNPEATNQISIGGSKAAGLFQILYPSTWNTTSQASKSPFDARTNALAAHEIFVRDGHSWRQWVCKP